MAVGKSVGSEVGAADGPAVGAVEGKTEGTAVGTEEGTAVGAAEGPKLGTAVGAAVGAAEGAQLVHRPPSQGQSPLQSETALHFLPTAQPGQSGPPQSISVSSPSCKPF